jgi:hypothetical protein
MNTHNFDAIKSETHDFDLVMGQNLYFETTIDETKQFYLILDEFEENSSYSLTIRNPILVKIIELKEKIFPTSRIAVPNKISLSIKLVDKTSPIIRVVNRISAGFSFKQHETVVPKVQNKIIFFIKLIAKIYDTKIVIRNRITATPSLRQYYLLSVYDPQVINTLGTSILQDMDYQSL